MPLEGSWKSQSPVTACGRGEAPWPVRSGGAASLCHSVPKRTGSSEPACVLLNRLTIVRTAVPAGASPSCAGEDTKRPLSWSYQ
jgi:hypothetical protein